MESVTDMRHVGFMQDTDLKMQEYASVKFRIPLNAAICNRDPSIDDLKLIHQCSNSVPSPSNIYSQE